MGVMNQKIPFCPMCANSDDIKLIDDDFYQCVNCEIAFMIRTMKKEWKGG